MFAKISPLVVNMVLARLLAPEAFGIVASIAIITSFADIFTDAGFQKYIIQHEYESEAHLTLSLNVAFTSNLIVSSIIYLCIALFSTPLAKLVGCPGQQRGIMVASLAVLCTAFSGILLAKCKRELDFKSVFYIRVLSALVPLTVTVSLAFWLRSYWAMVIGTLCQQIFIAGAALHLSRWKPRFVIDLQEFRRMISFSVMNLCETLSVWFTGQASIFIVANLLDAYYLGLYKTATATINSYMAIITASVTPVLFSALSRCQNDEKQFQDTFFKFQSMLALLVIPMGVGIFLYRDLALSILLGEAWAEATMLLGLWALTSSITIIYSHVACEVYRSKGLPQVSFVLQAVYLVFFIPSIYYAATVGFTALTYVSCGIRLLPVFLDIIVLHVKFKIHAGAVLKNTAWSIVSAAVMCGFAIAFQAVAKHFIWQICSMFLCALIYGAMILANKSYRAVGKELPLVRRLMKQLHMER
ncbi:MAG: oligosaccharide flippase family protein [Oscillospiraceae bacterium]|nr:oligosaccharide flippase family protein [Oscillospiraceae bacterium]